METYTPSQKPLGKLLSDALKNSWISLLIILLVFLLTLLDQSDTVVVTLLDRSPVNFFLFLVLLVSLCLIVVHYPVYLEFRRSAEGSSNGIIWNMDGEFLGLGFITYKKGAGGERFLKFFRSLLGVLLLTMVFYVIGNVHHRTVTQISEPTGGDFFKSKSYLLSWPVWTFLGFFGFLLLELVFCFPFLNSARNAVRRLFARFDPACPARALFWFVSLLTLLSAGISLFVSVKNGWSAATYRSSVVTLFLLTFWVVIFCTFRKRKILNQDLAYVKMIALSGCLSIGVILLAHFYPTNFNALVILLAYFNVFYGLMVIPLKHFLYYRQYDKHREGDPSKKELTGSKKYAHVFFSWVYPWLVPVVVLCLVIFHFKIGNDLHLLRPVEYTDKDKLVGLEEYLEQAKTHFAKEDTIFFVASYGGGIKATVWNLLVLRKLDSLGILDRTIAMSGASGGTIGQALYGGYLKEQGRAEIGDVHKLSKKNFVGIDLTYMLGRDMFWAQMPDFILRLFRIEKDRAKRAVIEYANTISPQSTLLTQTFQSYWSSIFRKRQAEGRWYPALIWNSAGTQIQRGIAFSPTLPRTTPLHSIFFDSKDLLSPIDSTDNTSLSYLQAASTSDRFPMFSPSAKIEGKGYFLDGGYFENSGLLSLWDFHEYLKTKGILEGKKAYFIQIVNDPRSYTRELIKDQSPRVKVKVTPEFGSILKTITSIEFVPSYLTRRFQQSNDGNLCYCQIQLPYLVREDDVEDLIGGEKLKNDTITQWNNIKNSNARILSSLRDASYAFVRPPLARLLGNQAFKYMEHHLDGSLDNCLYDLKAIELADSVAAL